MVICTHRANYTIPNITSLRNRAITLYFLIRFKSLMRLALVEGRDQLDLLKEGVAKECFGLDSVTFQNFLNMLSRKKKEMI